MISILAVVLSIAVAVILVVIGLVAVTKRKRHTSSTVFREEYDLRDIDIEAIDKMEDGTEFEMYLYRLFLELGYEGVYKTVGARDFGADVVFTDSEGVRNVVQAKRYTDPVGISAVQEVYSCMRYYKAKKAIVISSAKFTEACETLAGVNHVKLLDRNDLIGIIKSFKQGNIQAIKNKIESEPRMILESWSEVNRDVLHEIKKDYKAEKLIKGAMRK